MGTSYQTLYESVLSKIRDYDFLNLQENEIYEVLSDYIRPAIASFHICKQDLSQRTDEGFDCELTDMEIEILSNYMVIDYLDSNYIRVPMTLKEALPSKDFQAFSVANHLDKKIDLREMYRKNNESLVIRYSWIVKKKV